MATIAEAIARMAAALDRVEAAVSRPPAPRPPRPQGELFAAEERDALNHALAALGAERDELRRRLAEAEAENLRLQAVTTELSSGLDAAIGELKTVLEG